MVCTIVYKYIYIERERSKFFSPIILSNIHPYFNKIVYEFKILLKVITTETFNIDFHFKFIKFWSILFCFLQLLFNTHTHKQIYIYIYIYIYNSQIRSKLMKYSALCTRNAEQYNDISTLK